MVNEKRPKPVVLVILDGWGVAPPSKANAISLANTPNFDKLIATYPTHLLQAGGEAVGLAWGEMGNSEVGHLSLGSGQIIYQNLPRISLAITDGSFFKNPTLLKACQYVKNKKSALHLVGMVSNGGVHSYNEHLYALLELVKAQNIHQVFIHAILDGRDTPYNSGYNFITKLQQKIENIGLGEIVTLSGRFYAMDRDNHWERTKEAYQAIIEAKSPEYFSDPLVAIQSSYKKNIFDEEFKPQVKSPEQSNFRGVTDKDAIIFFNFRGDRARQLTKAIVLPTFEKFPRQKGYLRNLLFFSMTEYEKDLPVEVAFPQEIVHEPLTKVISKAGLNQLHIAETEKYAHVTYFFNGGQEEAFPNEKRILIPSPLVSSYDQKPEMSAREITDKVIGEINKNMYDFIVVNYANPDMVGHTGNLQATVKAIECVDDCLGKLYESIISYNGVMILTADHGNAEGLFNLQTGSIDKEHSNLPVPLIIIGNEFKDKTTFTGGVSDLSKVMPAGVLADVAPTILKIMGLKKPNEMKGHSLI